MYCGGLIEFQNSRVGKSGQGTDMAKVLINHVNHISKAEL